MEKLSLSDFKNHKGLITVTILLAFFAAVSAVTEPKYYSPGVAVVSTLIGWPLIAWWFMAFWNRILTKIFKLKEVSYGMAFFLVAAVTLLF